MTSKHTALHIICAILVLLLGLQSALAQTYEGETPVDMARGMADENGDIVRFRSLTIRWRFDGLMGEPLRQFAARYEHHSPPWVELAGAPVCFAQHVVASFSPHKIEPDMVSEGALDGVDLYTHSRLRMIIQPNSPVGFAGGPGRTIQHYFGVDSFSQDADYGPSVPGSPEWDRLFQIGSVGSEDISWLSEAQARELFRVGFSVSRIDMVEPKYALAQVKASYERHFRSKPCGDRPVEPLAEEETEDDADEPTSEQVAGAADASPDQPEPQTAAERLDAMLSRVAEARDEEAGAGSSSTAAVSLGGPENATVNDTSLPAQNNRLTSANISEITTAIARSYGIHHDDRFADGDYSIVINELNRFGVHFEEDLKSIANTNVEYYSKNQVSTTPMFLRKLMITKNIDLYYDIDAEWPIFYEDEIYLTIKNIYGNDKIEMLLEAGSVEVYY